MTVESGNNKDGSHHYIMKIFKSKPQALVLSDCVIEETSELSSNAFFNIARDKYASLKCWEWPGGETTPTSFSLDWEEFPPLPGEKQSLQQAETEDEMQIVQYPLIVEPRLRPPSVL